MSYGPDYEEVRQGRLRQQDTMALVFDLPIEQPTKFQLFINQDGKGARTEIPLTLLAMADRVIE